MIQHETYHALPIRYLFITERRWSSSWFFCRPALLRTLVFGGKDHRRWWPGGNAELRSMIPPVQSLQMISTYSPGPEDSCSSSGCSFRVRDLRLTILRSRSSCAVAPLHIASYPVLQAQHLGQYKSQSSWSLTDERTIQTDVQHVCARSWSQAKTPADRFSLQSMQAATHPLRCRAQRSALFQLPPSRQSVLQHCQDPAIQASVVPCCNMSMANALAEGPAVASFPLRLRASPAGPRCVPLPKSCSSRL